MSNSIIKLLQENIKKYRKEKNITQLKLSIMTGISKDYITSMDDLRKKCHLLRLAGLKPDNLDEIYDYMCRFTDFPGMTGIDKKHFFQELA